jgi:hypothetical protein
VIGQRSLEEESLMIHGQGEDLDHDPEGHHRTDHAAAEGRRIYEREGERP